MNAKDFIEEYSPYALYVQEKYGVPYGVVLAQAALESGWGESGLVEKALNFFGIKDGSSWEGDTVLMPTTEYIGSKSVSVYGAFRAYDDPLASFDDYGRLLANNPRYADVLKADDPYKAAEALERAGYATDPQYAEKLSDIIQQYDLDKPPKKEWKLYDPTTWDWKPYLPWNLDFSRENIEKNKKQIADTIKDMTPIGGVEKFLRELVAGLPRFLVITGAVVMIVVVIIIAIRGGKD